MNSIHDINLSELERGGQKAENDEPEDGKQVDDPFSIPVWPLEAKSADLKGIKLKSKPSDAYISKIIGGGRKSRVKKQGGENKAEHPDVATPFERYQLSRKILELLRDPEKRAEADLNNPLVKAVYDTLMYDPDQREKEERARLLQPESVPLAKVLPDSEFVPFNPFAQADKNPKKKRKVKNEPWQESFVNAVETEDVIEVEDEDNIILSGEEEGEYSNSDEDLEHKRPKSNTTQFISVADEKPQKKKKKKHNILNKLKSMSKSKRKNK
jgi:hypothetical protein